MKLSFMKHPSITKSFLDTIQVGDLVRIDCWGRSMKVAGVSANYILMTTNRFGKIAYSVLEKKPWDGEKHNRMKVGHYHCGTDNLNGSTGIPGFDYRFSSHVDEYLNLFETGKAHLSSHEAMSINSIRLQKGQ